MTAYVKDDVDLNQFAKQLEEECHRRGMTNVVANRIITINSEADRDKAPLLYAKTEFIEDFDGWALFYCKGPNGEQLEFNQVRRKAKENFTRAQKEYNLDNGNHYWGLNGQEQTSAPTLLNTIYSTPVNAPKELVWQVLLDKMQNPDRYMPYPIKELKVLAHYQDGVLREITTPEMHAIERVTVDESAGKITYDILNYPSFTAIAVAKSIRT